MIQIDKKQSISKNSVAVEANLSVTLNNPFSYYFEIRKNMIYYWERPVERIIRYYGNDLKVISNNLYKCLFF